MSRVFVIQATSVQADVSPARAYGDIVFVLSANDRSSNNPNIARAKLDRGLRDFNPETDYVVWAGGDPLSFFLVGGIFQARGYPSFRYLRYEKARRRDLSSSPFYVPVTVYLDPPGE